LAPSLSGWKLPANRAVLPVSVRHLYAKVSQILCSIDKNLKNKVYLAYLLFIDRNSDDGYSSYRNSEHRYVNVEEEGCTFS
jgi:hypothetical protein